MEKFRKRDLEIDWIGLNLEYKFENLELKKQDGCYCSVARVLRIACLSDLRTATMTFLVAGISWRRDVDKAIGGGFRFEDAVEARLVPAKAWFKVVGVGVSVCAISSYLCSRVRK